MVIAEMTTVIVAVVVVAAVPAISATRKATWRENVQTLMRMVVAEAAAVETALSVTSLGTWLVNVPTLTPDLPEDPWTATTARKKAIWPVTAQSLRLNAVVAVVEVTAPALSATKRATWPENVPTAMVVVTTSAQGEKLMMAAIPEVAMMEATPGITTAPTTTMEPTLAGAMQALVVPKVATMPGAVVEPLLEVVETGKPAAKQPAAGETTSELKRSRPEAGKANAWHHFKILSLLTN